MFGNRQIFPTGLLLPLSLNAFLPPSVFVFPSGLPDVPGYMPLSSRVQGTKATTRKEVRRGEKRADESVNLQPSGSYRRTGQFCDIQNDLECPVFVLLMFENACGTVMIGYYVGFCEGEFISSVVLVFLVLHPNPEFPGSG